MKNTDTSWLTQRIWKLLIFPLLMLITQVQVMMWQSVTDISSVILPWKFRRPTQTPNSCCTEADASADNVASYVMACEQTAYVEGIIAASTSESGKLGAIGPIPGDSLVKIINGYEDGAKSVNPDIEVQTAWTNSFVDTQLAQEAAKAMIDNGVDVIKHCANACGSGAMTAAVEQAGIWCQGDSYDQSSLAPDNILDSAIYNLDVVIDTALGSVADGKLRRRCLQPWYGRRCSRSSPFRQSFR